MIKKTLSKVGLEGTNVNKIKDVYNIILKGEKLRAFPFK